MKVTIPANQTVAPGKHVKLIFGNNNYQTNVLITNMSNKTIHTKRYTTCFFSDDYDPTLHGFEGIKEGLTNLCKLLNT